MPVRQKVVTFFDELGEFCIAVMGHWRSFMSSSILLGAALNLYERATGTPIALWRYVALLLLGLVVACFFAWREEHKKASGDSDVSLDLPVRLRLLSAEIRQFLRLRTAGDPSAISGFVARSLFEIGERQAKVALYHAETASLYLERYAPRVAAVSAELRRVGVGDDELDDANLHPVLDPAMQTVRERLNVLADIAEHATPPSLPDVADQNAMLRDEVNELHYRLSAIQPRRLTAANRELFIQRLSPLVASWRASGRTPVISVAGAPTGDCLTYSQDFEEVFSAAGFQVHEDWWEWIGQWGLREDGSHDDYRLGVTFRYDGEQAPEFAEAIADCLRMSGIEFRELDYRGVPLSLIVGARS